MKTKTLALKLEGDHFDGEWLRSLLERAIRITFPTVAKLGEHYGRKEAA
jgi:hypothetical protein